MQHKQNILDEIDFTESLKMLIQAYEEISVIKMQKIRASVLSTRSFADKLSGVFYDVKISYKREMEKMRKKKKEEIPVKKKLVSVLISANAKLYGSIVTAVYDKFISEIKNVDTDIMIVGRIGKELYESQPEKKIYNYFEIPDGSITLDDLKPIIYHLSSFQSIKVYYGRFESIINQVPTVTNVSGEAEPNIHAPKGGPEVASYFFEPSLEKILQFFTTQIFSTFFQQTVHESHLSRLASRIKAMEEALQNVDGKMDSLNMAKRRIFRLMENNKQLERLSGINLWKK